MTTQPPTFDRDTLAQTYISQAKSNLIVALCLFFIWPIYIIFLVLTISKANKAQNLYAGTDDPPPPQIRRYKIIVWIPVMVFAAAVLIVMIADLVS